VDTAADRANREIDLIREYRTRLVADVVAGRVDVRAAAAGFPDVAAESVETLDEADGDETDVLGETEIEDELEEVAA